METEVNDLGPKIEESAETPILIPCTICGRTFKSESLRKHQGVCQKNATTKRKVFDSMKQRIQGTELAEYIPIPVVPPKPKLIAITKVAGSKPSRDGHRQIGDSPNVVHHTNTPEKSRHAAVRSNSMSSSTPSRGGGAALKKEQCPHCDRTFGWKAFSRHEEWCREHKLRLAQSQSPAAVLKAKEMLDARIKYRAPLVGKLKRPTNREKYAGGIAVQGSSVVPHSLPKSSVPDVHLQNILSPKANVPSSTKERKNSTPKSSTVSSHHKPVMRKISAPVKREMSPSKEISHIINPPWDLNITNEAAADAKESTSSSRNSSEDDRGGGESPVKKTSYRLSTYDPFSKAEMQLRELLSDGGDFQKPKIAQSTPVKETYKSQTPDTNNHGSNVPSALNNGNLKVHNILNNQKQAKEDVLPDLFTETSTQLHFEMPNVMRGREESIMTKRRAMKPTAQNMGIDLNSVVRENMTGRRDFVNENIERQSENQKEHFSSLKDLGNQVTGNSNSVKGSLKLDGGDQLDIESIHQSINMVALGLANLSTNSHESLVDVDNNNLLSGSKTITERAANVDSSGNLVEIGESKALTSHSTHPASSGDGESDGDAKRIRRRKRRGKTLPEGEVRDNVSSPDCLVTFQNPISAKLSVDSAYSSLNRPSFRAVEEAKRAINKAFDSQHHQTSSEGEDDHADEWSEDEESKKNPSRWNQEPAAIIDPATDFKMAKFCHECGSRYPLTQAKFCCVCGARRMTV